VEIHKMYKEYMQSKGGMGLRQNDHANRKK
jgi:hypothetical protein